MAQSQQSTPSFLLKLYEIVNSQQNSHVIRWDKSGNNLCIICIHTLENDVLPRYFRHSKFSSFVRQLNKYGFHKRRDVKNMTTAFHNEHFSRHNINLSAIVQRRPKLPKQQQNPDDSSSSSTQLQSQNIHHECSMQLELDILKQSSNQKHIGQDTGKVENSEKKPEICELIEQLKLKVQPLSSNIGNLDYLGLQSLLRQPKYQKVNFAIFGIIDTNMINPLANLSFSSTRSNQMEFIL